MRPADRQAGQDNMAFSIGETASWLHQVYQSRAVTAGGRIDGPGEVTLKHERPR